MPTRRTLRRVTALLSGTLAALATVAPAVAQSNRATMITDDGMTRRVLSFVPPDVEAAIAPEYVRADLPLFVRGLELSDAQASAVQRLLEIYAADYMELLAQRHPQPQTQRAREGAGPGGGPDDGRDAMRKVVQDEMSKAGFSEADQERLRPSVGVSVDIGDDPEVGPIPDIKVDVSFPTDDDTIDEATRAKLSALADAIAARLRPLVEKDVMRQMQGEGMGGGPPSPDDEFAARWDEIESLRQRIRAFRLARAELGRSLTQGVRTLLADPQLAHWPRFERMLVRAKTLPLGELEGEAVDVLAMLEKLEPSISNRPLFEERRELFAQTLHAALTRRNELLETGNAEIDAALYEGRPERAIRLADQISRARLAVRDANDTYRELIAETLSPEDAERFRAQALVAAHPRVFTTTRATRAFEAVRGLEGLAPEVATATDELARVYAAQLDALNQRLVRTIRRTDETATKRAIERVIAMQEGTDEVEADPNKAIVEMFQSRQDLDARTMRDLYALLPESVHASLPPLPVVEVGTPIRSDSKSGS